MIDHNLLTELAAIVGPEHVLTSPEELVCYSYDGTFAEELPDAVISPASTARGLGDPRRSPTAPRSPSSRGAWPAGWPPARCPLAAGWCSI